MAPRLYVKEHWLQGKEPHLVLRSQDLASLYWASCLHLLNALLCRQNLICKWLKTDRLPYVHWFGTLRYLYP